MFLKALPALPSLGYLYQASTSLTICLSRAEAALLPRGLPPLLTLLASGLNFIAQPGRLPFRVLSS